MRPPYKLVQDEISTDTVAALEELLKEARTGKIIGVAFVAMYKRRLYIANAAGEAHSNPTFARGMVAALDDHLREMVHQ